MVSIEQRLQRLEDIAEISNLIASHPIVADSQAADHLGQMWDASAQPSSRESAGDVDMIAYLKEVFASSSYQERSGKGLAHFAGHPFIRVDDDVAEAVSYLELLMPCGASSGSRTFEIELVAAVRWFFVRVKEGWRIQHREGRIFDGSDEVRKLIAAILSAERASSETPAGRGADGMG